MPVNLATPPVPVISTHARDKYLREYNSELAKIRIARAYKVACIWIVRHVREASISNGSISIDFTDDDGTLVAEGQRLYDGKVVLDEQARGGDLVQDPAETVPRMSADDNIESNGGGGGLCSVM